MLDEVPPKAHSRLEREVAGLEVGDIGRKTRTSTKFPRGVVSTIVLR